MSGNSMNPHNPSGYGLAGLRIVGAVIGLFFLCFGSAWAGPQADLWKAAEAGDQQALVQALSSGAKVNARDKDGWTALLFAATSGELAVVNELLAKGANTALASKKGQTPLMGAVISGKAEVVQALLDAGARVDAKLPTGKTAADLARANQRLDIEALLTRTPDIPKPVRECRAFLMWRRAWTNCWGMGMCRIES